ncbi:TPA: hypothetical protein IWN28_002574 [Enterococcus faecium]|nr:hypothetical protein [Enterococcus faecium]
MSVFELPTVTLIPNGIHHPPIEDGRLLPNSVKKMSQLLADCQVEKLLVIQGKERRLTPLPIL